MQRNAKSISNKFFENIDFVGIRTEFIGTFAVVYSCGWAFMNLFLKDSGLTEVFLIVAIVYGIFLWSGNLQKVPPTFNPAITFILALFHRISWLNCLYTVISQLLASVLGASILKVLSPDRRFDTEIDIGFFGIPRLEAPKEKVPEYYACIFMLEFIGTFVVVIIYYVSALF